jgi:DNA (cytosine-5)-methyltransferase 1
MLQSSDQTPTHIDLFAGCGGISLGLYNAGWKGLFAIEKSPMAFSTLKHNLIDKKKHFDWPAWLPLCAHDITEVLRDYKNELKSLENQVDLVAGGPPCQGFSFAGRRNENDQRNKLAESYVKFVDLVKPRLLFFENVAGFTVGFKRENGRGQAYSEYIEKKLNDIGYDVRDEIVDFSLYGIPQKRKRFILVGAQKKRKIDPNNFFTEIVNKKANFLVNKRLSESVSLSEALSDLERKQGERPSIETPRFKEGKYGKVNSDYQRAMRQQRRSPLPDSHRFARHSEKTIERWSEVIASCPKGMVLSQEWKDKFGLKKKSITLLNSADSCPTLTTLPDDYIHYNEPRILTVRVYARIQSFPDWYEFKDKYTTGGKQRKMEVPRYTQVGNAVPPLFAELSGEVFKAIL